MGEQTTPSSRATVVAFPAPEPWPTELFADYGLADLVQLRADVTEEINRRGPQLSERARGPRQEVSLAMEQDPFVKSTDMVLELLDREPTDDEIYNRPGVEGGIGYDMFDEPGSLGQNDWRL